MTKTLLAEFVDFVSREQLFTQEDRILIAVSGGVDSIVLCELCHLAGYDFDIAHCNFQLRAAESGRDEDFVINLANKYGRNIHLKRFATGEYAAKNKLSIQAAARNLRYNWFEEIIRSFTPPIRQATSHSTQRSIIATAHHMNDSVETMLMNFFKGTGIAGLHGILPKQGHIVRPLIFSRKERLIDFATNAGLKWVEDSSNETNDYERNRLRHSIIPMIEEIYPGAINRLAETTLRIREVELVYLQAIETIKKSMLEKKGIEFHIPVRKLKKSVPVKTILFEIIGDFGFSSGQLADAVNLLNSETGRYIRSDTHRLIRNRDWLIIAPNEGPQRLSIIEAPGIWPVTVGQLKVEQITSEKIDISMNAELLSVFLDAKEIEFPLIFRNWRQGDYFYPLGMRKKKKVARFLIDNKLSKTTKENVFVLESKKRILWVIGMRIDERFKITPRTKRILNIEMRMT
ncbi:MAG TPA: tRNA lysidine(34) synthetase TilS [Puia sp.]|nr:tRNA lysidine(34) synthetase TilS [Puia sp.]